MGALPRGAGNASAIAAALLFLAGGCLPPPAHEAQPSADREASGHLFAVLVNGGGQRSVNYHSHLDHLRTLLELLQSSGVDRFRIAVFSGDGEDPGADLATREGERHPDFWLLPRGIAKLLGPPVVYVNSEIPGFLVRPALQQVLRDWFEQEGSQLGTGDTLLFYVTDHGQKNADDLTDNTITLWGEKLSVRELEALFALLDPGVRVVMLMSQCYSGSFANAIFDGAPDRPPEGNFCGYFSATADRRAHGCYPEVSGRDATGHSHRMFSAMARGQGLAAAQREVLLTDRTPDVPHTSSSFYLAQRLERAAAASPGTSDYLDELLAEGLGDPVGVEPLIRLLDQLGQVFGFASPRSFADLEEQAEGLKELSERLKKYAKRWQRSLDSLRVQNLAAFKKEYPDWGPRLKPGVLKPLGAEARRSESDELLEALSAFTEGEPRRAARLRDLHRKWQEAKAAHYRFEVRLAAVLRMRSVLEQIAGRAYLERHASEAEAAAFARLDSCEDLVFPDRVVVSTAPASSHLEPFPALAEEERRLAEIVPGWLGISYRPPRAAERKDADLPSGAVVVKSVLPDSPAAEAGLQVADILLGPPGRPFGNQHSVSEWTALAPLHQPVSLRLLRDEQELQVVLRLAGYPLQLPSLPGPVEIGSAAPALQLDFVRGEAPLEPERPTLLFFWASWCSPCKKAVPELLAFGRERQVEIVAISDESPEELEEFLAKRSQPFPERVAADRRRVNFRSYGVSGTPTFVLLDADGEVRHYRTGYKTEEGLGIDGWHWESPDAS